MLMLNFSVQVLLRSEIMRFHLHEGINAVPMGVGWLIQEQVDIKQVSFFVPSLSSACTFCIAL
jgi:hypothetical protein